MASQFTLLGLAAEAERIAPGLHIVATPIGNLGDITLRALSTLAAADLILAEDSRVTKVLLAHYGITTPIMAYHEHNASRDAAADPRRSSGRGKALALVSDAGTPLVSDPGYKLVEAVVEAGLHLHGDLPGASAVLVGLVLSGLPSDRFFFEGFLPEQIRRTPSPHRATLETCTGIAGVFRRRRTASPETLVDLAAVYG